MQCQRFLLPKQVNGRSPKQIESPSGSFIIVLSRQQPIKARSSSWGLRVRGFSAGAITHRNTHPERHQFNYLPYHEASCVRFDSHHRLLIERGHRSSRRMAQNKMCVCASNLAHHSLPPEGHYAKGQKSAFVCIMDWNCVRDTCVLAFVQLLSRLQSQRGCANFL